MSNANLSSLISAIKTLSETASHMCGDELYYYKLEGLLRSALDTVEYLVNKGLVEEDMMLNVFRIKISLEDLLTEEGIAHWVSVDQAAREEGPDYDDDDPLEFEDCNYTVEDYLDDVHKSPLWEEVKKYHLEAEVDECLLDGDSLEEACREWNIALPDPDDALPF